MASVDLFNKRVLVILLYLGVCTAINAQGTVRGKITDENGQPMVGASVTIRSVTLIGGMADLDGLYSLKVPESTPQILSISYIGYNTIQDTINPQGGEVIIRNYGMTPFSEELKEVLIVARAIRGKESYLEKLKFNSVTFFDFISTETIKKAGDSNVLSAISRITGVSTFGGFITVRGIGDRYIKTTINGLRIPTLDPFTNNIRLDLFPSSLIDNILIKKTASPDLSADWAGAYLSIETKEYPEKLNINIETTFGYNNQSTFSNIISSEKSRNWLGIDRDFRSFTHINAMDYRPGNEPYREFTTAMNLKDYLSSLGIDEKTPWINDYSRLCLVELGYLEKALIYDNTAYNLAYNTYLASDARRTGLEEANKEIIRMGQSLPNTWIPTTRKAPIDFSQNFSFGNQSEVFGRPFGYLLGFRYYSSTVFNDNNFTGRSGLKINEELRPDQIGYMYHTYGDGQSSVETNGWSALMNLAYKLNPNNSIIFVFMPNMIGNNRVRKDYFTDNKSGSYYSYYTEAQQYESRSQLVYQIKTDHFIPSRKIKMGFNASYTQGRSESPDYKQILYEINRDTGLPSRLYFTSLDNSTWRVFRNLTENLVNATFFAELPLGLNQSLVRKIKVGSEFQRLVRESDQHFYYLPAGASNDPINGNFKDYFSLDKFSALDTDGTILRYYNKFSGPLNNTIGFSSTLAGFILAEYPVNPALKISGGIRFENTKLHTDIRYFYDSQLPVDDNRRVMDKDIFKRIVNPGLRNNLSIFPNLNFTYNMSDDMSNQVNIRINYSRTTALPSLRELTPFSVFDYSLLGVVKGNSSLKPVYIDNFDIRGEADFSSRNNISASIFYKKFKDHIELVREDMVSEMHYSWQNADFSHISGIEIEGRLGLIKNVEARANVSLVESKTRLKNDTITRSMFGQAPYVINMMINYASDKNGIDASVSYNRQGPKLVIKGVNSFYPDIYELSRNIIDVNISKRMGEFFTFNFKIRDLLNEISRNAYKFPGLWVDYERRTNGTIYQIGVSYKIQ